MKNKIALTKLSSILVPTTPKGDSGALAASLHAELMRLGYMMSEGLFRTLRATEPQTVCALASEMIDILRQLKGDDVKYNPMYPNFPDQVMEASTLELYLNAMVHYYRRGEWRPKYAHLPKEFHLESVDLIKINIIGEEEFAQLFTTLLSSNDSLSSYDKEVVEWFLSEYPSLLYPSTIPYKETLCLVAADRLGRGKTLDGFIHTATDILRLATYLSGGDVSLASNTKFKSFPRKIRRLLTQSLEAVISEEDIRRHKNKWTKLFHTLHVCEYSAKVCSIAKKPRSNKKLASTNSKVQSTLDAGMYTEAAALLVHRPGDFARQLDLLLRRTDNKQQQYVLSKFKDVSAKVSTRVIMQMIGHFKTRNELRPRVIFPKGSMAHAQAIPALTELINPMTVEQTMMILADTLSTRFGQLGKLGKVWVDPAMYKCPLPSAQRSSSAGLDIVARGTRIPLDPMKNTLRFFIYWVGQDIDLSATLHDEKFNMLEQISYTNLRSKFYQACHSGDITMARNGASEFIDITLDKLSQTDIRYVVMNVLVYSGPNFSEHEKCYAGWMMREKPESNEIYEPKTVAGKLDLTVNSRNAIPVIFDVQTREAIWCDLITRGVRHFNSGPGARGNTHGPVNNVEGNSARIEDVLSSITGLHNKVTLGDLFMLHAQARGELVKSQEEADIAFGWKCEVSPIDINTINSDYLVG